MNTWIDAEKEAPIDNRDVVVWSDGELAIGWYMNGAWHIGDLHPVNVVVTHWMDVDPPPKEFGDE